ncbi:MAG: ribosome assembly RNA-binding protein YhbY [Sandaracinaceae bacterium]
MSSAKPLTGAQKRQLRSLAHHFDPVVRVGKEGVSESVVAAADQALTDHELIKVRVPAGDKASRQGAADALATGTRASLVGLTGRIAILYRRHPEKPKVRLSGR